MIFPAIPEVCRAVGLKNGSLLRGTLYFSQIDSSQPPAINRFRFANAVYCKIGADAVFETAFAPNKTIQL